MASVQRFLRRILRGVPAAYRFGDGLAEAVKIALHPPLALAFTRLGLGEWPTTVAVRAFGGSARIRLWNETDAALLQEIFVEDEYRIPAAGEEFEPELIVDLGSNIGVSVVYFALKYPRAKIVAVEADPDSFWKLEQNCRAFGARVQPLFAAVSARDGEVELNRSASSVSASLKGPPGPLGTVKVRGLSFESLLREIRAERVPLLKVDVEGAEWELFENSAAVSRVGALVGEYHQDLTGQPLERFERLWPELALTHEQLRRDRYLVRGVARDRRD